MYASDNWLFVSVTRQMSVIWWPLLFRVAVNQNSADYKLFAEFSPVNNCYWRLEICKTDTELTNRNNKKLFGGKTLDNILTFTDFFPPRWGWPPPPRTRSRTMLSSSNLMRRRSCTVLQCILVTFGLLSIPRNLVGRRMTSPPALQISWKGECVVFFFFVFFSFIGSFLHF